MGRGHKLNKFRHFHSAAGEGVKVVKTYGGRGSVQPHCQPRRPSTHGTCPKMNNNNKNNNKLVVGSEPAFVVIRPRLHLRQEKVKRICVHPAVLKVVTFQVESNTIINSSLKLRKLRCLGDAKAKPAFMV